MLRYKVVGITYFNKQVEIGRFWREDSAWQCQRKWAPHWKYKEVYVDYPWRTIFTIKL